LLAAAVCAVALAVAAVGCGGGSATPTQPPLTDPNEIVSRSISQLATETSVHIDGTLNGTVDADYVFGLMGYGSGALSGNIKLNNASLTGDVDMTRQAAHLSATFPTLFGLSAEVILVDGYAYERFGSSTGTYAKSKIPTSVLMPSAAPDATFDIAGGLDQLKSLLGSSGVSASLSGRDRMGGRDSYHITLSVPAELINQAFGAAAGGVAAGAAAGGGSLDLAPVDYWVYVDTLQPAGLYLEVSSAKLGQLDLNVTLSKYGQSVTIQAPPASQIGG
jgi:hypothetical protein